LQHVQRHATDDRRQPPAQVVDVVEGQNVGLDPNGHSKGMTGPVGYRHVDDIGKSPRPSSTPAPSRSNRSPTSAAAG
jgi:hypothetical protein